MRRLVIILLGVGMVTFVGYALFNAESTMEVVSPKIERVEVEKEVTIDALEVRIKEAQEAARGEIEAKADEMRAEYIANEMKTIEASVLSEVESELEARRIGLEKETGAYWREARNLKAYIREVFWEDPYTAIEVARQESGFRMIQSNHVYTEKNVPHGYKVGDREQSFCIFQIHAPVHDETAKRLGLGDYRTNVESCIKMARVIYDDRGGFYAWSVYKDILAMR